MNDIKRQRLASRIRILLAELYQHELKDPRIGFVTFTKVELNSDFTLLTIYVSVFGDNLEKKRTMAGLRKATGFIRSKIAKKIRMQTIPKLTFILDKSLENLEHIDHLLNQTNDSPSCKD